MREQPAPGLPQPAFHRLFLQAALRRGKYMLHFEGPAFEPYFLHAVGFLLQ